MTFDRPPVAKRAPRAAARLAGFGHRLRPSFHAGGGAHGHPDAEPASPREAARPAAFRGLRAALAATGLLAACASPPSRFYTLSPAGDAAPMTHTATTGNPAWLIELAPIDVPSQVAKNQFVVQTDANRVKVLEEERWSALPGDEIRRALSGDLTQQLDTIDVYGSPHPDGVPVYRVSVNVQRFESWPGSHALIDAVWSVRALSTQSVMTCRSVLDEPVRGGYNALVEGHRRAVQALAASIASGVRALAAMPAAAPAPARVRPAPAGAKGASRVQPVLAPVAACPLEAPLSPATSAEPVAPAAAAATRGAG